LIRNSTWFYAGGTEELKKYAKLELVASQPGNWDRLNRTQCEARKCDTFDLLRRTTFHNFTIRHVYVK
jgi:hypothetical protein